MSSLGEADKLVRGNQGSAVSAATVYDHDFAVINHIAQKRGEILAGL
jgi:hypothetical protein